MMMMIVTLIFAILSVFIHILCSCLSVWSTHYFLGPPSIDINGSLIGATRQPSIQ